MPASRSLVGSCMGVNCELCGKDQGDESDAVFRVDENTVIAVCIHCLDFLDKNDKLTGRLVVTKYKECGHISKVTWTKLPAGG